MIQMVKAWALEEIQVIHHQQGRSTQNAAFYVLARQKKVAHVVCIFLSG